MIIFLYGQDTFRSREELKRIIQNCEKTSLNWFNFVRIDAKDNEIEIFEQIRESTNTISMFNEKKLIVIENIFSAPQDIQKEIPEFLKNKKTEKDENISIVFWSEESDEKNELFKFLKTTAKTQKFEELKGVQLRNWIKNYILEQDGKIDIWALGKLIEYVGSDLWRMSNEINKLLSYNPVIKIEDIESLVKPEIDLNIFDMVDALGQKNKVRVINLFNQHLEKGGDEFYLLSMFIYQIRNLLRIKSTPISKLDLHPFVIRKTQYQVKNFTFEELKKIYYQLMTIELEAKTGKADISTALELFLAKI
jgi:DNA polymerase-3 subunit delta